MENTITKGVRSFLFCDAQRCSACAYFITVPNVCLSLCWYVGRLPKRSARMDRLNHTEKRITEHQAVSKV